MDSKVTLEAWVPLVEPRRRYLSQPPKLSEDQVLAEIREHQEVVEAWQRARLKHERMLLLVPDGYEAWDVTRPFSVHNGFIVVTVSARWVGNAEPDEPERCPTCGSEDRAMRGLPFDVRSAKEAATRRCDDSWHDVAQPGDLDLRALAQCPRCLSDQRASRRMMATGGRTSPVLPCDHRWHDVRELREQAGGS